MRQGLVLSLSRNLGAREFRVLQNVTKTLVLTVARDGLGPFDAGYAGSFAVAVSVRVAGARLEWFGDEGQQH
jgi:hypothetical protein